MKKIILIILICIITLNVHAIGRNEYVIDDAKILSNDTKNYILEYSNYLKDELNIDFVVITINNEEANLNDVSRELYDEYHISKKGILMLVDKKSRNINVLVGDKLSSIIPDDIINKYIKEYMIGYYSNDLWDDGTKNGYTAFYKLLCNYYGIDSEILEVYEGDNYLNKYRNIFISIVMVLCVAIGYNLMKYYKNRFITKKKNKTTNLVNDIMFFCSVFINVELFIIAYYFGFNIFLMVFLVEIISIISSYFTNSNNKRSKHGKVHSNR